MEGLSTAVAETEQVNDNVRDDAETAFLGELTLLSRKYRRGIAGDALIFIMEWDDDERVYASDSESRLSYR